MEDESLTSERKRIKVKFIGQDDPLALRHGKAYDAVVGQKGMLGIIDETGEEYAYPPNLFEEVLLKNNAE